MTPYYAVPLHNFVIRGHEVRVGEEEFPLVVDMYQAVFLGNRVVQIDVSFFEGLIQVVDNIVLELVLQIVITSIGPLQVPDLDFWCTRA